ncbi:hypothetical protein SLEP1_g25581 [Rubroshorea leprosula]|uniref:Uncharacterized protein n=1 Tax=Rubroshorea leprosula TaxID=152421 RepID=A0AAV5JTQ4_9ROSI|nr:hypothetical protein SLEP1_g25581 [Rubroshorea leprosula]
MSKVEGLKEGKILDKDGLFLFLLFLFLPHPILLFFPLQPKISPKQAAGTSLEKPVGKAWFSPSFLALEHM